MGLDMLMSKIRYLKKHEIYCIMFVISLFFVSLFSVLTSYSTSFTNSTSYISFLGFKIYDFSATVALIIGILAFFATLFNTDKTYKAMKLSSVPEKSINLLIDLKFIFNEYEHYNKKDKNDEFIVLTKILKYWNEHQKAFTLLTPYFYKEFLKIVTTDYYNTNKETEKQTKTIENKTDPKLADYSKSNSKYIFSALIAQITNIAFENGECCFEFIEPRLIKDEIDIAQVGATPDNYRKIKINKNELEKYIKNIEGTSTNKLANSEFENLYNKIKKLVNDLKREIEEYE